MSKTTILNTLTNPEAVSLVQAGAVAVIPTDTVYGLVCKAALPEAVSRLYGLKNREAKPGTIIAASIDQLVELGVKRRYLTAVAGYWPNPISIEIPLGANLEYLHQGVGHQAFRITSDPGLRDFLEQTGPLLTSSANQPGEPPANTLDEARQYFGDTVDLYVDGGDLSGRLPSTLIRIVDDAIDVVRTGAIKIDENGRISR